MSTDKRNTLNFIENPTMVWPLIISLCGLLMIGVGLYMTQHYFQFHFTTEMTANSVCSINSFWNCDNATDSPIAAIFNIPLGVFGLIVGGFFLAGTFVVSENIEATNRFLAYLNFLGCIVLFTYSLTVLGGLCPMCSAHYVLSTIVAGIYFKKGNKKMNPNPKILTFYAILAIIVAGGVGLKVTAKNEKRAELASALYEQFSTLKRVGDPQMSPTFWIHKSNPDFSKAPLRISIFSDFECPACKYAAETLEKIILRHGDKINVQYLFYPLDQNCNGKMNRQLHPNACKASYLAICHKKSFKEAHDTIFADSKSLTDSWFSDQAKKWNIDTACMESEETKQIVQKTLALGETYSVEGTPTLVINGVKLGLPSKKHLHLLLDEIIKRQIK